MTDTEPTSVPDAAEWVKDHGSIVGFPTTCKSDPKAGHVFVKFDRSRYNENMAVFRSKPPTKWLVSPDVAHMLVGSRKSASSMGHTIVCDPSLPENTIVPARKK